MAASAKYFPVRGHILLCEGASCKVRGSELLLLGLTRAAESQHLVYYKTGGQVRLTSSGCLGACGFGPTLVCYRERNHVLEQAWYQMVDFALALEIMRAAQEECSLPTQQRYDPFLED